MATASGFRFHLAVLLEDPDEELQTVVRMPPGYKDMRELETRLTTSRMAVDVAVNKLWESVTTDDPDGTDAGYREEWLGLLAWLQLRRDGAAVDLRYESFVERIAELVVEQIELTGPGLDPTKQVAPAAREASPG